jgi:hypothetical protein
MMDGGFVLGPNRVEQRAWYRFRYAVTETEQQEVGWLENGAAVPQPKS